MTASIGSGIYLLFVGAILSIIGSLDVLTIRVSPPNYEPQKPASPSITQRQVPQSNVNQRFCSKCGKPLQQGARFCSYCGATSSQAATSSTEKVDLAKLLAG
jgi:hypothetical protein